MTGSLGDHFAPHRPKNPIFADISKLGRVSVWDFLRTPELVRDDREIVVRWGTALVALTHGAWAVWETSEPPGFNLPLADVKKAL